MLAATPVTFHMTSMQIDMHFTPYLMNFKILAGQQIVRLTSTSNVHEMYLDTTMVDQWMTFTP
jgi:hypothetical protein